MSDYQSVPVTAEDLVQFDKAYENADVSSRDFEPVPDATYQVRVEAVELTRTQRGVPILKWTLRILGPTHQGRLLWRSNLLATDDNSEWLKKDMHACEVPLARTSELPTVLGQLLDLHLEVVKKTRGEYDNVFINKRIKAADWRESADPDDEPHPRW